MSGRLFVISAPSGAGKTTLLQRVMAELPGLVFSISHTTRLKRVGEEDGRDYHFVTKEEFGKMIEAGLFLEYALVHGNYYGTTRQAVEETLAGNQDVVLDIDVQGAAQVQEQPQLDACTIFIAPPGLAQLAERLQNRGTETQESLKLRLANAREELAQASRYQYLLVNEELEEAVAVLRAVVVAERARGHRRADGTPIDDLVGEGLS